MKLSDSSSLPRISLKNAGAVPRSNDGARQIRQVTQSAEEAADAVKQLTSEAIRDVAAANRESSLSRPEDAERLARELNGRIMASPKQALAAQAVRLEPEKAEKQLD